MKSMTGFAKHSFTINGVEFVFEIKSLNNRFLSWNFELDSTLSFLEQYFFEKGSKIIFRGSITVKGFIKKNIQSANLKDFLDFVAENLTDIDNYLYNNESLNKYYGDFIKKITPSDLINFYKPKKQFFNDLEITQIESEMEILLKNLENSKIREGEFLYNDLNSRNNSIIEINNILKKQLEQHYVQIKNIISEKIKNLSTTEIDPYRLEQELIFLTKRYDFSEEITRLDAHISLFSKTVQEEQSGRKLDFILQEMNREANTIASKGWFAESTHNVVLLKSEIEKMKEQIQNVE